MSITWTKEIQDEFRTSCRPIIDFLNKYGDPHSTVIVEQDHAELKSGEMIVPFEVMD